MILPRSGTSDSHVEMATAIDLAKNGTVNPMNPGRPPTGFVVQYAAAAQARVARQGILWRSVRVGSCR
jgi:hypothetical protein